MRHPVKLIAAAFTAASMALSPARASIDHASTEVWAPVTSDPTLPLPAPAKNGAMQYIDLQCNLKFDALQLVSALFQEQNPEKRMAIIAKNIVTEGLEGRPDCDSRGRKKIIVTKNRRPLNIGHYQVTHGVFSGEIYRRQMLRLLSSEHP